MLAALDAAGIDDFLVAAIYVGVCAVVVDGYPYSLRNWRWPARDEGRSCYSFDRAQHEHHYQRQTDRHLRGSYATAQRGASCLPCSV